MFLNSMPRLDVLRADDLATLDAGWERLAAEVGVRFDHPRALELFREAGQTVDGEVVHFDPASCVRRWRLPRRAFTCTPAIRPATSRWAAAR